MAEKEKYFRDAEPEFEALLKKVAPNKSTDLIKYQDEITEVLENEIASRYYYQKGRIEVSFKRDPYIQEAIRVLNNPKNIIKSYKENKRVSEQSPSTYLFLERHYYCNWTVVG